MKSFRLLLFTTLFVPAVALVSLVGCQSQPTQVAAQPDYPVPFCRISSSGVGCSATLVDRYNGKGLVITCEHCVGGSTFQCRFTNGLTTWGTLLDESESHDLAAFVIGDVPVRPAKIGAYDAQGVYRAFGFGGPNPSNTLYKLEGRVVESGMGYPGRPCCENLDCHPIAGDSGSGTLNDRDEFVGVLWGGNSRGALITCGTPVTEFLNDLVARGLWQPSSNFTPGGQAPTYLAESREQRAESQNLLAPTSARPAPRSSLLASTCSGPSWETCRRVVCQPVQTKRTLNPIFYGCPPGRNPIDPRDAAPRQPAVQVSPVGIAGDAALVAFALLAGGVVLASRFFRQY